MVALVVNGIGATPIKKTFIIKVYEELGMSKEANILKWQLKNPKAKKYGALPKALGEILSNKAKLKKMGSPLKILKGSAKTVGAAAIVEGLWDAAAVTWCCGWCLGSPTYDPVAGNLWSSLTGPLQKKVQGIIETALDDLIEPPSSVP